MCILFVYTLLKAVSYYDLSVLSMSVMGFQKKVWMGLGGWGELYRIFVCGFLDFFNFEKPLRQTYYTKIQVYFWLLFPISMVILLMYNHVSYISVELPNKFVFLANTDFHKPPLLQQ